jgi:hypothetical protein
VVDGEVQSCDLEDMVAIDEKIGQALGEDSHTPLLTKAPYPYAGISRGPEANANNDAWLLAIRDGHWPIPGTYKRDPVTDEFSTQLEYDGHDFGDKHLGFMMLAPAEMQQQITEAAHHGLTRRLEALDDPDRPKGLVLPGEDKYDTDPLAYTWRGAAIRGSMDAINTIDQISDDPNFLPLMQELAALPDEATRIDYLEHYASLVDMPEHQQEQALLATQPDNIDKFSWVNHEKMRMARVGAQMRMMVGITNFNVRHREGRDLTPQEQEGAKQVYLAGLVRVAGKLAK